MASGLAICEGLSGEVWSLSPAPSVVSRIVGAETGCFQGGCQMGIEYLCLSHHPHRLLHKLHISLVHGGRVCREVEPCKSDVTSVNKP